MAWGSRGQGIDAAAGGPRADRVAWPELRGLIASRVPEPVLRRLAYVPADRLAPLRPQLKALRTELRAALKTNDRVAHDEAYGQLAPLYLAGVLCSGEPAEALDWLTSPVLRDAAWQHPDGASREPEMRRILLALLLEHRDGAWQRDLAGRLAQWLPAGGDPRRWELVDGLAAWSGARPAASDGYVVGWVKRGSEVHRDHLRRRLDVREWFAEQGWRPPVRHHATLVAWLRAQPRLRELVPRLFDVADIGTEFDDEDADRVGAQNEWAFALALLADEATLDRGELIDLCLAKLLRGDRPGNLRGFVLLIERLAPGADEIAARLATYVALAGRGAGTCAKLAQGALKELDAAGRLGSITLAEISKAVLARPEKSLAASQLSWVDTAIRRDRGAAPELLRAVATAFEHPAVTVQERAVRVAVRHLKHLDTDDAARLREAAGNLDAVLRDEALRVFDSHTGPEMRADTGPPARAAAIGDDGGGNDGGDGPGKHAAPSAAQEIPATVPAYYPPAPARPVEDVWELVELFGAVLADGASGPHQDAQQIERVLDAVVAQHELDAETLSDAVEPLVERFPAQGLDTWDLRAAGGALRCLLHALQGRDLRAVMVMDEMYAGTEPRAAAPDWALLYRVYELVENLDRTRVPCLLAAPTHGDGSIDPDVLRLRLERYERSNAEPLPCDLEQALLRVPVEDAQEILAASPLLATRAGKELAALFAWGEGVLPVFERFVIRRAAGRDTDPAGATGADAVRAPRIAPRFSAFHELVASADRPPSPITVLGRMPDPDEAGTFARDGSSAQAGLWASQLPYHPEVVAGHAVPTLYQQANDTARDRNALLPLLARTAGWPGPVVHLALAYGLAANRAENRAAAVDALVTLAARELLDARALGALCSELWVSRMIKPNRLLLSLDAAAQSGAGREVFTVVASALPSLAPQPSVRGLADLLVLGSE
ncbi:MAG: DUF6493 family protein, partial [Actinocrinis sp.]